MARLFLFILIFLSFTSYSQTPYSRYDSLKGGLTPLRTSFDIFYYDLELEIDPGKKHIEGSNTIYYQVVEDFDSIQIDLFSNFSIKKISNENTELDYTRDSNFLFIKLDGNKGDKAQLKIEYEGEPISAKKAPWDGGFVWTKDQSSNPWVGVACQGTGTSLWWPCKDHFSDEPDSMRLSFTVPDSLYCASNGTLRNIVRQGSRTTFEWFVHYPINSYNATLNIGKYAYWKDSLQRPDGSMLLLEYYVLEDHLGKAQKHFQQVGKILNTFEKYFGSYPFPNDGYALIETPYWGMEHQSAISYGNNFETDLIDFDFIIVHESAHEWWGNSLTAPDIGELWIHETFATYAEALLIEDRYGFEKSLVYLKEQKALIKNKVPLMLPPGVHFFNSQDTDIYYKGSWILHTLRNFVSNDSLWFGSIKRLSTQHTLSTITTKEVIRFFEKALQKDLQSFFSQYLYHSSLPVLEYYIKEKGHNRRLYYRWKTDVTDFKMPVLLKMNNEKLTLPCSSKFKYRKLKGGDGSGFEFMTSFQLIDIQKIENPENKNNLPNR